MNKLIPSGFEQYMSSIAYSTHSDDDPVSTNSSPITYVTGETYMLEITDELNMS